MDTTALERVIAERLPSWVAEVRVSPKLDWEAQPSLDVAVVVCTEHHDEVLADGEVLNETAEAVQDAVRDAQVDLWPYTRFVSASEIEAAGGDAAALWPRLAVSCSVALCALSSI